MKQQPLFQTIDLAQATKEHPRNSEMSFLEKKDGTLMMVWMEYFKSDLGSNDHAPCHFATKSSTDGGLTWQDKKIFMKKGDDCVNIYSPNFIRLANGQVLFIYFRYLQLAHGKPLQSQCLLIRSDDDGDTWSKPEVIWDDQPINFASSVIKQTSTGRLILPVSRQTGLMWSPTDHFNITCLYSDDLGKNWKFSDNEIVLPLRGSSEGHIVELTDGDIMMVLRTQLGSVFHSFSNDDGRTWSKAQTTGQKSPESCPEIFRIPKTNDLMLVWNNSPYNPQYISHYGRRTPLSVALSKDEGRSWSKPMDIANDYQQAYSNPVAFSTKDQRIIIGYWMTQYKENGALGNPIHMRAALFDIDWLYTH